mgnify:CR=1 FL=1
MLPPLTVNRARVFACILTTGIPTKKIPCALLTRVSHKGTDLLGPGDPIPCIHGSPRNFRSHGPLGGLFCTRRWWLPTPVSTRDPEEPEAPHRRGSPLTRAPGASSNATALQSNPMGANFNAIQRRTWLPASSQPRGPTENTSRALLTVASHPWRNTTGTGDPLGCIPGSPRNFRSHSPLGGLSCTRRWWLPTPVSPRIPRKQKLPLERKGVHTGKRQVLQQHSGTTRAPRVPASTQSDGARGRPHPHGPGALPSGPCVPGFLGHLTHGGTLWERETPHSVSVGAHVTFVHIALWVLYSALGDGGYQLQ